jgi:hypothetical protein
MPPELKNKLKKVLAGRSSVDMGQVRFLNLGRVRERAGGDWDRLREKIYEVGHHFIEKRLDGDDAVIRCRGGFMIIFAALDGEAAQATVDGISQELERFFLGDSDLGPLEILAEARSVTIEELLEIVARDQDESARPSGAGDAEAGGHEPGRTPPWRPDRRLERAGETGTPWVEAPRPGPRPVNTPRPRAIYTESEGVWDDIVFKPCWDGRKSALLHNICVARRVVKGFAYYGRDTLTGADDRTLHRKLDESVARAAQRGFQKAYAQGGACAIIVPVHYDTIATLSQRMRYFAILQSVPEPMRRFFFLRVDGVPDGAPLGQMQELFRSMKHFGAYVLTQLPFGASDLKRFDGCGIGIFGTEVPARMNETGPDEAQLMAMADWVASACLLKAETYFTQTAGIEVLQAGLSAGVRYFSGPLIAPEMALPEPARPLSLAEILDAWQRRDTLQV